MIILGSTGSIGVNALDIALKNKIDIEILVAGDNIDLLNRQITQAKPKIIVIKDKNNANRIVKSPSQKLLFGESGILEALNLSTSKVVVNALVGFSGLMPSVESLRLGKTLTLANKETLVIAGFLLNTERIIPIDSEHFAVSELMRGKNNVKNIIITASGGAFRDTPLSEIPHKGAKDALKHPNWAMGRKITIDSASMVNKLFEILEAKWLFKSDRISALIETNSIIHALIQTSDNAIFAHLGSPDMRLPISSAILRAEFGENFSVDSTLDSAAKMADSSQKSSLDSARNERVCESVKEIDLSEFCFNLREIEVARYPLWRLKNEILANPKLGVIINAANDFLVEQFLNDKIPFGDISRKIFSVIEQFESYARDLESIEQICDLHFEISKKMSQN